MEIRLRITQQGNSVPWSFCGDSFDVGRDSNCELSLDGDTSGTVSWRHCRFELRQGGLFVSDLGSTNGTFLNGRKIETRAVVKEQDAVRLGNSGPELRILDFACEEAMCASPQHDLIVVPETANKPDVSLKEESLVSIGDTAHVARRPSTTRMLLVLSQQKHKKSLRWGGTVIAGAMIVVGGVLWNHSRQVSDISRKTTDLKHEVSEMTAGDTEKIFKQYGDAVYLVAVVGRNGGVIPFGTAFAISTSGEFATNAHVAKPVNELLERGTAMIVIAQGGNRRYPIIRARWHPLYDEHAKFHTPDVGVLTVRLPPGDQLSAIPLASDADLREVIPGAPLCYIGFPAFGEDDDYSAPSKVVARTYQGRANRLLTLHEEQGEFSTQQLVEHDMMSWGGASGSPIFGKRGKVIAIHFAGSMVHGQKQPSSPKWGMRIDLLKKILEQ